MNYMKEIANTVFGVEFEELFQIKTDTNEILHDEFYMTSDGLQAYDNPVFKRNDLTKIFENVCKGTYTVVKKPWKPSHGSRCYFVASDGYIDSMLFNINDVQLLSLYEHGKLYRTKEEAQIHCAEDMAFWETIWETIKSKIKEY